MQPGISFLSHSQHIFKRYLDHDAAGDGQISVKPGVPDATTVTLNAHLVAALLGPLRPRLHLEYRDHLTWASEKHRPSCTHWLLLNPILCSSYPEAGAVRMCAHHGEAVPRLVAFAHSKGDDAGEIPGQKILSKTSRQTCYNIINSIETTKSNQQTGSPCWMVECSTDPPPSAPWNLPLTDTACILQQLKRAIRIGNAFLCFVWF